MDSGEGLSICHDMDSDEGVFKCHDMDSGEGMSKCHEKTRINLTMWEFFQHATWGHHIKTFYYTLLLVNTKEFPQLGQSALAYSFLKEEKESGNARKRQKWEIPDTLR